jgi:hypothetical protein
MTGPGCPSHIPASSTDCRTGLFSGTAAADGKDVNGYAEIDDLVLAQHGIVTRVQALETGVTRSALNWRIRRGGPWQTLLPGVYATFTGPVLDVHRWQAALLYGGDGAALTSWPALILAGIDRTPRGGGVPVLIPHDRRRRSLPGVTALRTRRPPTVWNRSGLALADPTRSLADACRLERDLDAVRALVTGCLRDPRIDRRDLREELELGPHKGSALLRSVLGEFDAGARSVAEARVMRRILSLPLPRPLFNVDLRLPDESFLARPDAYWPEAGLAFEIDSREFHAGYVGLERTQRRHARLTAAGVLVLHASRARIDTDWPALAGEIEAAFRFSVSRPNLAIVVAA